MKNTALAAVLVLVALLGITGSASAQCDAILSDGLGPSGGNYQIGDSINYYVRLSCPAGSCPLTIDRIEFYPPPGSDDACDDTPLFFIEPGTVLVPGDGYVEWNVGDWPDLAYTIQPGDAGTYMEANICTKFSWTSSGVPLDDEDTASSINFVDCPEPCIEVTKTVDCDISKVGDVVTYEICVENCGTYFDLTGVEVYDDQLASVYGSPLSGFPTSLAPGEQFCAQFDYEIQPGDDTGADYPGAMVTNTAHVTSIDACDGISVVEDFSDEVIVYLVHPGIDVEKVCLTPYVLPGELVEFGITITNTGDIALDVTTDEPGVGPLTVDAHTSTEQFVVTRECGSPSRQGDPVYNEINVTATIPVEFCELPNEYYAFDSAECLCIGPCIDVTKEVDCDISKVGDTVMYTICITNCSSPSAPLVNVSVMDDVLGNLSVSNPYGTPFPTSLAEGEQVCRTFTYEIQPGDDDGQDYPSAIHENTVTVTAEHEAGYATEPAMATEQVTLVHPGIDVEKVCLTDHVLPGELVEFGITIYNTGDIPLDITTDEPEIGPMTIPPFSDTGQIVVTRECGSPSRQGDPVYNEINVTATIPVEFCDLPNEYYAFDSAECLCIGPCIDVTKEVDCDISKVGDTVMYTICVTNCSSPSAPLVNVSVMDDVLGDLTDPSNPHVAGNPFPTTLAEGEQVCRTITYEIQPGDDSGADYPAAIHENTVTVNAEHEAGYATEPAMATEQVMLVHPGIDVEKVCLTPYVLPGELAEFGITIYNTGDIPLYVVTDEPGVGPLTLDAFSNTDQFVVTGPCGDDRIFGKHNVARERTRDPVTNEINVTATIPVEFCALPNEYFAFDSAECECIGPCIDVTKEVDCETSKVGDSVVYTICVTNCSDPAGPIEGLSVVDDVLGNLSVSNPYGDPFPTTLAEGEQVCRTFTYEIQPGDDDGQDYPAAIHENTVTVNGSHPSGAQATEVYATEQVMLVHPGIDVEKVCLTDFVLPGELVEFGITIYNTGDIPLDVTTDEPEIGPMTIPPFSDSGQIVVTRECGSPSRQGDPVYNEINVTATIPVEFCELPNEYYAFDSAECLCIGPCIDVTKEVDCDVSKVGDSVMYTICITNCSAPAAPLVNVTVMDDVLGDLTDGSNPHVAGNPFPTSLAEGEQVCRTFTYEIQPGDDDGQDYPAAIHENTVTVTAEHEAGYATEPAMATEQVMLVHPGIDVEKVCLTPYVLPGEDAEFGVTIHNTGDIALDVTTDEAGVGPMTIPAFSSTDQIVVTGSCSGSSADNEINVTATIPVEFCELPNEYYASDTAMCECIGPCIDVTKEVDCETSKVGDSVVYTICVTNCSDPAGPIEGLSVVDDVLGNLSVSNPYGDPFPTTLAEGEQVCRTFTYEIQPGDDDGQDYPAAIHENTVTVNGSHPSGAQATEVYATEQVMLVHPGIDVEKVCLTPYVLPGDDAEFGVTIHNTGDIALDVTTDEAGVGPMTIPAFSSTDQIVVTGSCSGSSADNEINVTATIPVEFCELPNEYYASDTATCECIGPCIDVTKEVDCETSKVGDSVVYTICVTNCSDPAAPLVNVTVDDDVLGDLTDGANPYVAGNPFPTTLGEGEQVCRTFTYEIQPGDDDGQDYPDAIHENTVTATGEHEASGHAAEPATATEQVMLVHPGIDVEKTCLETEPVPPGEPADFEIVITNTGDIPLNIVTTSGAIPPFTLDAFSDYTIVESIDCGTEPTVYNEITVTATIPVEFCALPNEYTDTDSAECPCGECELECSKTVEPDVSKAGHDVYYEVCAVNTGTNCDLTLVSVVDDLMGDLTANFGATLPDGGTECYGYSYTIPEGTPSPLVNTVTFTYMGTDGEIYVCTESAEVTILHPDIDVSVECTTDLVPYGGHGEFEVVITNTGDVDLVVTTDWAPHPGPFTLVPGANLTDTATAPCEETEACFAINVHAVLPEMYGLDNEYDAYDEACCECEDADCRWTGGGTITWDATIPAGAHVTHGFQFRCNLRPPNRLEVNWGHPPGDKWHMTELLEATCLMNPDLLPPDTPEAPCNEVFATGVGRYNNEHGYIAEFHFTDQGQPGVNDWAEITITAPDGTVVLQASGYLEHGNHQAHKGLPQGSRFPTEEHGASEVELPADGRENPLADLWSQPVPNPFTGATTIHFGLPKGGPVTIEVYDVAGRHISTVLSAEKGPGPHQVVWDGRNDQGVPVDTGVYFYRFTFENETLLKKMIVLE